MTMDDATSEIFPARFVEEEGTTSSFQGLEETISSKGLFRSLYVDRGSRRRHAPEAGGKVDKGDPTQVGRALRDLGIGTIAAHSPQARERSERMFGTPGTAFRRSFAGTGSRRWRRPTAFFGSRNFRSATRDFRVPPRGRARLSRLSEGIRASIRSFRSTAWSGTTTRRAARGERCRFRRIGIVAATRGSPCGFGNIPTTVWRSSAVPAASDATSRAARRFLPKREPRSGRVPRPFFGCAARPDVSSPSVFRPEWSSDHASMSGWRAGRRLRFAPPPSGLHERNECIARADRPRRSPCGNRLFARSLGRLPWRRRPHSRRLGGSFADRERHRKSLASLPTLRVDENAPVARFLDA